jgi:GT2 family glycosyltransferase
MGSPDAKGCGVRWKDDALNVEWLPCRGSSPYPVPMVSACFMAARRETFARVGGFDSGLRLRGCTDTELCLRLWTLGLDCVVVPSVEVAHEFRAASPYPVDPRLILHNLLRVGVVHFSEDRLRRLVAALRAERDFAAACALLASSDAWARRGAVRGARRCDDDWFFEQFAG